MKAEHSATTSPLPDFTPFPKMGRLSRQCVITEKIDGTNAQVFVSPDGVVRAGSRTRWISPQDDNFGFAAWVKLHEEELREGLGPGRHFGEWWGAGIQRKYGLSERRFSLFNVIRWCLHTEEPGLIPTGDPRIEKWQDRLPECCGLVPILYRGIFTTGACEDALESLRINGSEAARGFMKPEGIVCYHLAANVGFKKTLENDEQPKGAGR